MEGGREGGMVDSFKVPAQLLGVTIVKDTMLSLVSVVLCECVLMYEWFPEGKVLNSAPKALKNFL